MENYYEYLGIKEDATMSEIKKALEDKSSDFSNDKEPILQEIEDTLLNDEKRKDYDIQLKSQIEDEYSNVADLISKAEQLLAKDETSDALMYATKATEEEGNNPDAWATLAKIKAKLGEIEDAIYEYKKAIKLRPNDAKFYYELSMIYYNQKDYKLAEEYLLKAINIVPEKTLYRAKLGALYVNLQLDEKAIEILEQCVNEEQDNYTYKNWLASAYHDYTIEMWDTSPYKYTKLGTAATSEEVALKSKEFLTKAKELASEKELLKSINIALEKTNWALEKHWDWGWDYAFGGFTSAIVMPIGVSVVSLGLIATGSPIAFAIGIGSIVLYVKYKYVPGWKINKRLLEDEISVANTTGYSR